MTMQNRRSFSNVGRRPPVRIPFRWASGVSPAQLSLFPEPVKAATCGDHQYPREPRDRRGPKRHSTPDHGTEN